MRIQPINSNVISINNFQITPKTKKYDYSSLGSSDLKTSGSVYFKGMVQQQKIAKLFDDYRWFIHADKEFPVVSLLKIKTDKESYEGLLRKILSDDECSYHLIDDIVKNPRAVKHYIRNLDAKLPTGSELFLTFLQDNLYRQAYSKYIDQRLKNATSISELLQIRPDWKGDVLLKKHQEIYNNDDFELGVIPQEIGEENFHHILGYLKQHEEFGYKVAKSIPDLYLDGKCFSFSFFVDGRTDKNVFGVTTDSGKRFVIKFAAPQKKSLDSAFALGTLCKIDTYLTRNHCRNSAPLHYYNHAMNASIYDFIEHRYLTYRPSGYDIHRNIPDFVDLGLRYNDTVGSNNLFVLDDYQQALKEMNDWSYGVRNSEWVSVDNDHVIFENRLQPKLYDYHMHLPSLINF